MNLALQFFLNSFIPAIYSQLQTNTPKILKLEEARDVSSYEINNTKKTMEDDSRAQGFKRGLEADKILGAADNNGELMYLIQW